MITHLTRLWNRWRLRRAQEKHAYRKARSAAYTARTNQLTAVTTEMHRNEAIYSGCEAKYAERVECLLREGL